jgi:predicted nucleic acid-binding protein
LSEASVFDFDLAAARAHAQIWFNMRRSGTTVGAHDLIIASTAIARDIPVLTGNVREFSRIPGLQVRRPSW